MSTTSSGCGSVKHTNAARGRELVPHERERDVNADALWEGVSVRFVVHGPGAVGGVVAACLSRHGNDVIVIARGAHADTIEKAGLTVETPDARHEVRLDVVRDPAAVDFAPGDVVLLAVKSQDTLAALESLGRAAPSSTPIVCLQNGVENERAALRRFENVYAVCVMCPTGHLVPGVVQAFSSPITGILDIGRYPTGTDTLAEAIAGAFEQATFSSVARADIMQWKYAKLLTNLGNALEAACGPPARRSSIAELLVDEGVACLLAAGIEFASEAEDATRRGELLTLRPVQGAARGGGSTWQSLTRRTGSVETDYLNGEIVLLGRQYGVPTPANALMQQLAADMAAKRAPAGSITPDELLERLTPRPTGVLGD